MLKMSGIWVATAAIVFAAYGNGAFAAEPAVTAKPAKVVKKIDVDGVPLNIVMRGDQAEVEYRGFFYNVDANFYIAARKGAEVASGCKLVEGFPAGLGLYVAKLDCSSAP